MHNVVLPGYLGSECASRNRSAIILDDLAAILFWRFGLDPSAEIHDLTGRPYRLAEGQPIREQFAGRI